MKALMLVAFLGALVVTTRGADLPSLFDPAKRGSKAVLIFAITEFMLNEDGANVLTLSAKYEGEVASLRLVLPRAWKNPIEVPLTDAATTLYSGSGRFLSTGDETRRFARGVAKAFRVPAKHFEFTDGEVTIFTLNCHPSDLGTKPALLQLVSGKMPDSDYLSLKCLLDIQGRMVEMTPAGVGDLDSIVRFFSRGAPKSQKAPANKQPIESN